MSVFGVEKRGSSGVGRIRAGKISHAASASVDAVVDDQLSTISSTIVAASVMISSITPTVGALSSMVADYYNYYSSAKSNANKSTKCSSSASMER